MTDLPFNQDTPFLILVNHYDANISWTKRLIFPFIVYEKENMLTQNKVPKDYPFLAKNKAKSESNLLKFCYDFYDRLPKNLIVVHQYEHKNYHQGSLVDLLNDPGFPKKYYDSLTPGYYNFNTYVLGEVAAQIPKFQQSGFWANVMVGFKPIEQYGDFTLLKKGCAQMVVSAERIRSLPRRFYGNAYDWLCQNTIDEVTVGFNPVTLGRLEMPTDNHVCSNKHTSRYLEWTWELIFTSHKEKEQIEVLVHGRKVSAIYGAMAYYRNVTKQLIKHFHRDQAIVISVGTSFNSVFGDTMANTVKTLKITIDGKSTQISENVDRPYRIPL